MEFPKKELKNLKIPYSYIEENKTELYYQAIFDFNFETLHITANEKNFIFYLDKILQVLMKITKKEKLLPELPYYFRVYTDSGDFWSGRFEKLNSKIIEDLVESLIEEINNKSPELLAKKPAEILIKMIRFVFNIEI